VLVGQYVVAPRADVRRGDPSAGGFAMGYQPAEYPRDGGTVGATGQPPTS
jgi:hypothetical protein